ncbi:MAG TPA: outer membrane beta-barrel protein, partial [Syntrophales bacterium]|nr:outer membrane beta-barrel protein [Syntrophales bacterium]
MRKKQFYSAVATALIFMAVTVGLSWAQDFTVMEKPSGEPRINIGNLTIIPGLQGVMTYDDNIYKGNGKTYANAKTTKEEKVVSDMIYHLKPGIMANFIIPERGGITAGWTLDRAWYNTETNNNFQNNGGFLNFDYKMPEGILIGLKDTYSYNTDPYGNADQYGVGTLTERWSNEFNAKTGYTIGGNFRPMLYYNYYIQQYNNTMKDWAQNYGQNQFGAGLQYRVMPNTWAFVRYMYTQKSYIDNLDPTVTKADSKTNAAQFGFAWDSGAKLSGEVNFGYQWRRYDNEYVNVNNTGVRR